VFPVVRLPVVDVLPLRLPDIEPLPDPFPVLVPRFMLLPLPLPLFMLLPVLPPVPLLPIPLPVLPFIIGVGDIIGVLMVFMFEPKFALRALTLTFVFPESPQPNEPAAISSEAVIMVFLMVTPVCCQNKNRAI
jgi:hypothetical protein